MSKNIEDIVTRAILDKKYYGEIFIGQIPASAAARIKEKIGINVKGFRLVLDANHIRHAWKHPEVELTDFLLISEIVGNADSIQKGNKSDSIVFKRKIFYEYTCVEIVVEKEKLLRLKTFWIKGKKNKGGQEMNPNRLRKGAPDV